MENNTVILDLSENNYIIGIVPLNKVCSVQMLSTDINENTTFNLQFSLDGINWANAKESGIEITDTLIQSETLFFSFRGVPGNYFRLYFNGSSGEITCIGTNIRLENSIEPDINNALLSEDGLHYLLSEDGTVILIPEDENIENVLLTEDGQNYLLDENGETILITE